MIVYVIETGEYSDRHICAITDDKEKAEKLKLIFTTDWEEARVRTYDTDAYNKIVDEEYHAFSCYEKNGEVKVFELISYDLFDGEMSEGRGIIRCDVLAVDEEHAKKIFCDRLAEYKAQKEGI